MTALSGVVTYLTRIALPAGAVVRVRVEDTAKADAPATPIAETEIVTQGEQVPIPFALDADLPSPDAHARPALRASIEVGSELWFTTTSHTPVPDTPDGIELVVDPVTPARPSLGDTEWSLVELAGEPVRAPDGSRAPSLLLDLEESRVSGSGGVNRVMGTFTLTESELRFGPLATTLMAGPEDAMTQERAFLDALARVTSYSLEGASLTLLADDEPVARLTS